MKMLVFVISLGVLYWAMTSFAQTRLATIEPCAGEANISVIGHAGEAGFMSAEAAGDGDGSVRLAHAEGALACAR